MTSEENRLAPHDSHSAKKPSMLLGIRSRFLKIILLSLVVICSLAVAWNNAAKNDGKDFYQFWVVGQSLDQRGINIYAEETRKQLGAEFLEKAKLARDPDLIAVASYRGELQTYSTPFFYAMFRIFSSGHYSADLRNYRLLMLAALAAGIFIFCRLVNLSWAMTALILAIFSIWFDPLASDLYVGNVNSLQFGALAIYLLTVTKMRRQFRDFVGGLILGLTLAFKPNLIFVAGALAANWIVIANFRRLWLHALGGIVAGALAIFFAVVNFHNLRCWDEWLASLGTLSNDNIIPVNNGNFSPAEIIYESFHLNLTLLLAVIFTGIVILLLWERRNYSRRATNEPPEPSRDIFVIAIGCLLTIIASRLAWFHYYVLTIPAFIFVLASTTTRRSVFILRQTSFILAFIALTPIPAMIYAPDIHEQAALAAGAALLLFLSLAVSRNTTSQ